MCVLVGTKIHACISSCAPHTSTAIPRNLLHIKNITVPYPKPSRYQYLHVAVQQTSTHTVCTTQKPVSDPTHRQFVTAAPSEDELEDFTHRSQQFQLRLLQMFGLNEALEELQRITEGISPHCWINSYNSHCCRNNRTQSCSCAGENKNSFPRKICNVLKR